MLSTIYALLCIIVPDVYKRQVSRNNLVIDLGTLTDEYEKEISIHTTATSKDGEKTILAGKEVTIVDTVKLDGLTKGTKYQLKGWQMLKEENTELIIDGKRVENDYTFIADDEEMEVEISYTFNASALGGKNLVTFEELYDLSNPDEPVKVAEHKDIEDDGQTVLITERIIKIHTTATDKDGNKEIEAGKDVTIIDTVTLEGLEVGTQYKLVGWQMLKEENAELLINGKHVESDYTFSARFCPFGKSCWGVPSPNPAMRLVPLENPTKKYLKNRPQNGGK